MPPFKALAWSSVGKKLLNGATGLGLVGFIVIHLTGNLLILVGQDAFNRYSQFLHHLAHGMFIYVAEAGLLAFFVVHIVTGVSVWLRKSRARTGGYAAPGDAGPPSRKTAASRSMLYSGILLAVYVPLHVAHFKYGPARPIVIDGQPAVDLYSLVVSEFKEPLMVALYVGAMLFLALHLRHGLWSMLQSLGLLNRRLLPAAYTAAALVGALLAFGFILLPVVVHLSPGIQPDPAGLAWSPR
jgi:succinate dehydrogenase / fumarate reductase cytochrome b subunit